MGTSPNKQSIPVLLENHVKSIPIENHLNTVSMSHLSTYKNAFRLYLFIKVFSKYM